MQAATYVFLEFAEGKKALIVFSLQLDAECILFVYDQTLKFEKTTTAN